jgi:D-alanyl-D-alanine carboxypeptidase (penicillin-binding protein 5/6)
MTPLLQKRTLYRYAPYQKTQAEIAMKKILSFLLLTLLLILQIPTPTAAVTEPEIISSKTAVVYCLESDTVLYDKGIDESVYPAALVKLMTALVVYENMEAAGLTFDSLLTVSRRAYDAAIGNNISLQVGETMSLGDLMTAMIVAGANDAALVLSEAIGGSIEGFVELMNQMAAKIGMTNSYFGNPTGIHHTGMKTTPRDLIKMTSYAIRIPYITELCGVIRAVLPPTNLTAEERIVGTRNYLISDRVSSRYYKSMATGMICGSTQEAGYCAIGTGRHDGLTYIAIITGAGSHTVLVQQGGPQIDEEGNIVLDTEGEPIINPPVYETVLEGLLDAGTLLTWAHKNYSYKNIVDRFTAVVEIPVKLGQHTDSVTLMPLFPIERFVPNDIDMKKDVTFEWELYDEELEAPIKAGQEVGILTVYYLGEKIGTVPLIVRNTIERSGGLTILSGFLEIISTPFFLILGGLIAFTAIFYVITTAMTRQKKRAAARREYEKKNRYLK